MEVECVVLDDLRAVKNKKEYLCMNFFMYEKQIEWNRLLEH